MQESGSKEQRFPITYYDGVNSSVQPALAKRSELSHAENARSPQIGVLEKREGYTPKGTGTAGDRFVATDNYGLAYFPTTNSGQQGVFRVSASGEPSQTLTVSVYDQVAINENAFEASFSSPSHSRSVSTTDFQTFVVDYVTITEPSFIGSTDGTAFKLQNTVLSSSIYALSTADTWAQLADSDAQGMVGGQFDFAIAEGNLVAVNQKGKNRMIAKDGTTVTTSSDAGSLYNSPDASKVVYYKSRIHLADFTRNGVRYPTSIIRSSFPVGIIALVDGDHLAGVTSVRITDNKYFYTASGVNTYDVYRGTTKIETITVTAINETSITVNATSNNFNSSDEIWVAGTFTGEKQFRWINTPPAFSRDAKLYDTFRLAGGTEDPITLFETIGNVILIGNKYTLATWDDYTLTNMDLNVGCSSPNGYAKLLGTLYFIHYSGIYATTGGVPTLISRKIDRYIKGATKEGLENAAVGIKGLSVMVAIGDVTLYRDDGSYWKTLQDVVLEYSVADQNWYVHTNIPAKEFLNFTSTDGTEHLLGDFNDNAQAVMDTFSGLTDDGKEIFFRVDTQEIQLLKEFETFVNPLAIVTETRRGSQLKVFVGVDDEEFYELEGTVKKGASIVKVNARDTKRTKPVICRKMRVSYRDSSKQRCRISQSAIVYLPTVMDEPKE